MDESINDGLSMPVHYVEGVDEDSGHGTCLSRISFQWHVGFYGRNYILHEMIVVSVRPLHVHLGAGQTLVDVAHPRS